MLGGKLAWKSNHLPIRFISNHRCVWILVNLGRRPRTPAGKAHLSVLSGPVPVRPPGWAAPGEVVCCRARLGDLGLSFQEDVERTQIHVLAVQAITSLVLSAMTVPVAGNPAVSCLEQQPRNKPLKALDTRWAREARAQGTAAWEQGGARAPSPLLPGWFGG